ncbi:MAG TPA: NAD(P)/FAD-dependent oxidoreductase [Candidatus Acidoferrum sp.]|nr:NAD(P)/FAD-dependent oxidoreductase [Candidatus Acidoferrum sp.]
MNFQNRVLVVGGGPAGLAASIALRSVGFRVTVIDSGQPPIEKVCGEGLLPATLAALGRLGLECSPSDGYPFPGIRYIGNEQVVEASFPHHHALGLRRLSLHQKLVECGRRTGVRFLWGTCVDRIGPEGVYANRSLIPSEWIVGADGAGSRVRKWIGITSVGSTHRRYAFRKHYQRAPWSNYMEVYWGRATQFCVTPVGSKEVCVVVTSRNSMLRIDEALLEFPLLASRLGGADCLEPERGATTSTVSYAEVYRGNVALVGDASGTVDAITGEGLRLAFLQAEALAETLVEGNLALYGRMHRELAKRPARMARLMLAMDGRPWLQRRALRALASEPELFGALLEAHVGQTSLRRIAAAGVRLGWRMATA